MPIKPENRARYPKNWKEIRERIRERAGNKCELCGVANHSWIRRAGDSWDYCLSGETGAVRIVCTVMHLDHTPENCDGNNLLFGCQRCHNRYDSKHRAETRRKKDGQLELAVKGETS